MKNFYVHKGGIIMAKKNAEDKRSKRFVFVPFCVMCQAFQAQGIVKYDWSSSMSPIIELLMEKDVNMIQMPCPESSFHGYENGLGRNPAGLKYYDVEEYQEHCKKIAESVLDMINGIRKQGYIIVAVLGIEMSPSCAVSYIYSNKGMQKRKGVYFDILAKMCQEEGIDLTFVGVNRRNVKKSLEQLTMLLE